MIRDTKKLGSRLFDLVVVGGGIYGAWTAYDAALRGLKTAVIEKGDWASGTSSACSKLIHGGLRYLEQLDFHLVKKSLDERKRLAQLGPHRVIPLRFLLPVYKGDRVGRFRLRAGLSLYDMLAGKQQPVTRHETLRAGEVLSRYDYLKADGLEGGFTFGDCVIDDARFTLEIVDGASRAGAVVANYVRANKVTIEEGRAIGVTAADTLTGESIDIRARVVVNATGAWAPRVSEKEFSNIATRITKGVHLVLPKLPGNDAMLVFARSDDRVFFVIPWYDRTLLGTTDTDYGGDPDDVRVEDTDIDYLLSESSRVLPNQNWNRLSLQGSFAGLRLLRDEPGKDPSSLSREWSLEEPQRGLLVSVGGKFTSARADAAEIVDRASKILGRSSKSPCPTENRWFPWCPSPEVERWRSDTVDVCMRLGLDPHTATECAKRFGGTVTDIQKIIRQNPDLAGRIVEDLPFCKAEIKHAVETEMALTFEDLFRRRIPLLVLKSVTKETTRSLATLAGEFFNWTPAQCDKEADKTLQRWGRQSERT